MRNCSQLVLVQANVTAIERLQNHVTSVAGWLGRIAIQLEQVLVRVEIIRGSILVFFDVCRCTLTCGLWSGQVRKQDAGGTSEERIRNLYFECLGPLCSWRLSNDCSLFTSFFIVVLGQFGSNFLGLLGNLVACLLKLIILVVDYFLEGERLLRVTVSREGVQDLRQLRLTDDRVLNLTDIFVCEDDVGLVNSEFKGQEQDRQCYLVTLTNLYLLHFAEVWFRNSIVILLATLGNFIFFSLGVGGLGGFSILLLVCVFLVALILNLNVEDDVLGECIFDLQVNLESLVELC